MMLFLQYRLGRPFILWLIVPLCDEGEPSLTFIPKLLLALLHCQTGGVENHMYQLSQCLIKQGHKVAHGLNTAKHTSNHWQAVTASGTCCLHPGRVGGGRGCYTGNDGRLLPSMVKEALTTDTLMLLTLHPGGGCHARIRRLLRRALHVQRPQGASAPQPGTGITACTCLGS